MRTYEITILQNQGRHLPEKEIKLTLEHCRSAGDARGRLPKLVQGCRISEVKELR